MPVWKGRQSTLKTNYIRVLGSADWHQTKHNDHSCYTIDDQILIDACPGVVTHLLDHGVEPLDIPVVCFTHMHCDHYMGLAPLLHYWRVCKNTKLGGLTIIGPKATVRETVMRTLHFVFGSEEGVRACVTEMPQIIELEGDTQMDLLGYQIRVMDSDHAVPGLCYRITDRETGHAIGLTGDTAYLPAFGTFFKNVDLLVHEASYGAGPTDAVNPSRHSGAYEAAQVCKEAQVKSLLLTHTYEPKREAALGEARKQLTIPVQWALPYEKFTY